MIIDGKKISLQIQRQVKRAAATLSEPMTLMVFSAGNNAANNSYISKKIAFAKEVGVVLIHVKLPTASTLAAKKVLVKSLKKKKPDAAILQLPVSKKLHSDVLIDAIPGELDVDALGRGKKYFLSPVILSIQKILQSNHVSLKGKKVVIVGAGRLVGKPAEIYFTRKRSKVVVCDKYTKNISAFTKKADILVTGAGAAHIISPGMVKRGVVALDIGFSMKDKKIVGDIHPAVAKKASVFTPVPGGIGAMTVAYLFYNVFQAKKHQNKAQN